MFFVLSFNLVVFTINHFLIHILELKSIYKCIYSNNFVWQCMKLQMMLLYDPNIYKL